MSERTHKRDLFYSKAHRTWGNLPMTDIDSIEYDCQDNPVAMLELKHSKTTYISITGQGDSTLSADRRQESEIRKLIKVAASLQVPLFVVVYWFFCGDIILDADDYGKKQIQHKQFYVIPINHLATQLVSTETQMSEKEYVSLLYKLRGQDLPIMCLDTKWKEVSKLPRIIS
jgi:hypothetical protein